MNVNSRIDVPQQRMKASDFHPELLEIYDGYAHGLITKREFLERAQKFAVGGVTAIALLQMLSPNYAHANQVAPDDPAITTEEVTYDSPNGHGTIKGLLSRPAGVTGKLPAVLVIHENRGLNPYIADVNRRMAKAGFLSLAPDGLSPLGGYPGTDDEGKAMQASMDGAKLMEDFFAATDHLLKHADSTGKVGAGATSGANCAASAAFAVPTGSRRPASIASRTKALSSLDRSDVCASDPELAGDGFSASPGGASKRPPIRIQTIGFMQLA